LRNIVGEFTKVRVLVCHLMRQSCALVYHLTTVEFNRIVEQRMNPNGIYLVNIIDKFEDGEFLKATKITKPRSLDLRDLRVLRGGWVRSYAVTRDT
jgi:hypothetical protein